MMKENPYLLPSLIVLLAAIIVAGALFATRQPAPVASQGAPLPANYVLASTSTPAHLGLAAGQQNPADAIPHVGSYAPQGFTITEVGASSITGIFGGATTTFAVTPKTEIYSRGAQKDPAAFEQEVAAFTQAMQYANSNDVYLPPDPYVHVPHTLAELKPGLTALVSSSDGKTADVIFVQQ